MFSPEGRRVCYIRDNNLFVENLTNFKIIQLTTDGEERIFNGRAKPCNHSMIHLRYNDLLKGRDGYI